MKKAKELMSTEEFIRLEKIKAELSKINEEYSDRNPAIMDTVFTITHRIETFINHSLKDK